MRLYTFSHFMLSSMAKGIQTLHSTVELFNKHTPNTSNNDCVETEQYDMLYNWSLNHKTCISLDGGTSPDLNGLKYFLEDQRNLYPWATFNEDESLGNLMTAISLVIPEKIYGAAEILRKSKDAYFSEEGYLVELEVRGLNFKSINTNYVYSTFEQELVQTLNMYRLAS